MRIFIPTVLEEFVVVSTIFDTMKTLRTVCVTINISMRVCQMPMYYWSSVSKKMNDKLHVFHHHNVSNNDSVFSDYTSVNCSPDMYIDSGSSLDHNLESFQYIIYIPVIMGKIKI